MDRKDNPIAISIDGTYRILRLNGKTWPMINGGPCANYYSGPGNGSEYSTTVINCLFQFCRVECGQAYESFFSTMKNLPANLFGLDPFMPDIVGCDRSPAIVNASLAIWPDTFNVLCWPHVSLYLTEGKFRKHMSQSCTPETRDLIEGDIIALHSARSEAMFDVLFECMSVVWTDAGEAGFVAYFRRHYGNGVWKRWWYGAACVPGVPANQNSKESQHKRHKIILGKDLLNAPPLTTATVSVPLILAAEGKANAEKDKWPSTLTVVPRLSATVAAKARNLTPKFLSVRLHAPALELEQHPPSHPCLFLLLCQAKELEAAKNPAQGENSVVMVAYVMEYGRKLEDVTPQMVLGYSKLKEGLNPLLGKLSRKKLERLKALNGLHEVVVHSATFETQSAFLKRSVGVGDAVAASRAEDGERYVKLTCDCEDFMRSGSICPCTLAVASAKFGRGKPHIDLNLLLESTAATRQGPGRPRAAQPGNRYGGGSSSLSSSSTDRSFFDFSQSGR